jgi:hypothetical protein
MQAAAVQAPFIDALQLDPESEQSVCETQDSVEQVPSSGGEHTAVTPQSLSLAHAPVPLTRASAETWKSLNTTRPHWLAAVAATGVLNVMLRSMSVDELPDELPYTQRWLGGLIADFASWRGSLMVILPSVEDAPTLTSHCANAVPLGND